MTTTTPNQGYPLPAGPTKLKDDVLRLIAALTAIDADVAGLLAGLTSKANVGHGHAMADISGLVSALSNKLDEGYHDALANLTDVDVTGVANGMALLRQASKWIPVALQIGNIAGLEAALNAKATPADITAAINALVAAAPGVLDTLDELAAALGDDPAFATTVMAALANRVRVDAVQAFTVAQQVQARANIGLELGHPLFHVEDQKSAGTDGGSSIAGTQTRTLNTIVTNDIVGASLSANVITLPEGTYWLEALAPAYDVGRHRLSLVVDAGSVGVLRGGSEYTRAGAEIQTVAFVYGRFVVSPGGQAYRLFHYTGGVRFSNGLGVGGADGAADRFAIAKFWKLK